MFTNKSTHTGHNDSYSNKYRDYFEYDSFQNSYKYFIKLENFNDNENWPLDNCISCNCDLNKIPPVKTAILIGKNVYFKNLAIWISALTIPFIFLALSYSAYNYIVGAIIVLAIVLIILFFTYKSATKPVHLFYCKECGKLIYSISPYMIISTDPPKTVFSRLERLEGFKLK